MMKFLTLVILLPIVVACDGGLTLPPDIEPGIVGTMTVIGSWPQDSVDAVWLFASQIYPLDSSLVIAGIFQGKIHVYPSLVESLPLGFDTLSYSFRLPPETYYYIGVLQRFVSGADLNIDNYRVVGVYSDPSTPGQPLSVRVRDYETVAGVNIPINFTNPPPQPF